jgi:lipopolysaccharide/colanic/teichoic acid biosynthesis glycosyltransferase
MAKRLLDIGLSLLVLAAASPLLGVAMVLTWVQDGGSPLYRAIRVGRGGMDFRMVKLRSMRIDAERRGGTSTALSDRRITPIGHILRRWKLDELPQFWNVLIGEMSVVGPRPNTRRGGVDHYTAEEMRLLSVRPGITDLASIVFSDEGDILDGAADPDGLYDAIIRPWKSRLGLLYVDRGGMTVDLRIVALTLLAVVAKPAALRGIDAILKDWGASDELRRICHRRAPLPRADPPGAIA